MYMMKLAHRMSNHHKMIIRTSTETGSILSPCRRRRSRPGDSYPSNHHYYYSTTSSIASSWNPFSRNTGDATRVASAKSSGTNSSSASSSIRTIQERKDTILVILATEFRRLSLLSSKNIIVTEEERETLIDKAFESIEEMQLDSKSLMQLRHTLQESLQGQVVELFTAFASTDSQLPQDLDDDETNKNFYDSMLELELEHTIDQLLSVDDNEDSSSILQASKGAHPRTFLNMKRGALETLLESRRKSVSSTTKANQEGDEIQNSDQQQKVAWVEADEFGYHETIDQERNALIRHYQAVNLCRSAKLRGELGYSVVALQSSIPGAGRGVYVDGYARAGSILAFQPGEVWSKEHLISLPVEEERKLEKNDNYAMSLRPDDFMIDSRKAPYTVLTNNNSNSMAIGHIINHPSPSNPPNCRSVMVNFTQTMDLDASLKRYIPNTYARPRNLTFMGSLWEKDVVDMHGICLVATRDVCNEEIFYDYRLLTPQLPSWYVRVEDTAYSKDGAIEEEK